MSQPRTGFATLAVTTSWRWAGLGGHGDNTAVTTFRTTASRITAAIVITATVVACSSHAGAGSTSAAGTSSRATTGDHLRTSTQDSSGGPSGSAVDTATVGPSPIPLVRPGQPGLVVGHRGNRAGAPEDTLASEVSAAEVGAQVLEFDLHMTSDGVPVVMHDSTVDRTTDGSGAIGSLTLAQIERLDAGSSFSPAFAGIRVPTLEQVLAFAAPTSLIVLPELKEDTWTTAQVRTVVGLIRQYHMADRTMFQSFYPDVLRLAATVAPDIARAVLVTTIPSDPVAFVKSFDGQGLLPEQSSVTADLVATLHRAGLSIMVWTVDDPDAWAALTADGVDGIMSNNPGALYGWMQGYRQTH